MTVFVATLLAFGFALLGLALGRLLGRRGPCGHGCAACPGRPARGVDARGPRT